MSPVHVADGSVGAAARRARLSIANRRHGVSDLQCERAGGTGR